ncbi:MAG: efflux RND transporter periplasmic adaptor subunit [Chloroflexota bacterium]
MHQKIFKYVALIALWLLIVAILNACGLPPGTPSFQTAIETAVPLGTADPATVPDIPTPVVTSNTVTLFGSVEPVNWVELSFLNGGRIEEVLVAEGEFVSAGQPLARLHISDLSLTIDAAQAAVDTAAARLTEIAAGPRQEEIDALNALMEAASAGVGTASAQYALVNAGPGSGDIAAAQAAVAAAAAAEKQSRDFHDQLIMNNILGTPEEQARLAWQADTAALTAAQAALDDLLAGASGESLAAAASSITAASANVESVQAQLDLLLAGSSPEAVAVLQAEMREAEIALAIAADAANVAVQESLLTAPFDGVVVSVSVRPSETIVDGETVPVIVLADLTHMQVVSSDLDELFVATVQPGQKATITFDALSGLQLAGTVSYVGLRPTPDALDPTVTKYSVIITLDNADPLLRWGMTANVEIETD